MIMPIVLRQKRVVIDVDTQRDFFEDASGVCIRSRRIILANIMRVIGWAGRKRIRMISTVQEYAGDDRGHGFCIAGTRGQEKLDCTLLRRRATFTATDSTDLPRRIFDDCDQVVVCKRCFDPFLEPRADRMLTELKASEFIIIGAGTESSVKATALGLLARHKKVTVVVDATGGHDRIAVKDSLRHLWAKGAKLCDTGSLIDGPCQRLLNACYYDPYEIVDPPGIWAG